MSFQVWPGTILPYDRCIIVVNGLAVRSTPNGSAATPPAWVIAPGGQGIQLNPGPNLIEFQYEYNPWNQVLGTPPSNRNAVFIDDVFIDCKSTANPSGACF